MRLLSTLFAGHAVLSAASALVATFVGLASMPGGGGGVGHGSLDVLLCLNQPLQLALRLPQFSQPLLLLLPHLLLAPYLVLELQLELAALLASCTTGLLAMELLLLAQQVVQLLLHLLLQLQLCDLPLMTLTGQLHVRVLKVLALTGQLLQLFGVLAAELSAGRGLAVLRVQGRGPTRVEGQC
jgi:hypothetical protein